MRYEGTIYRPPSEAGSLLIQATIGCPHNRCRFCGMYKATRFRVRLLKDVLDDLDTAREVWGPEVRTLFLPDGNTIVMKTASLAQVLSHARECFPALERITVYGSARFIKLKDEGELKTLREAGLTRIHMGLESGDEATLARMGKGATAEESVAAGRKARAAGLELSVYYLLGLGGRDRLEEHALASAEAINAMAPDFVRIRTLSPSPGTPLYEDVLANRFETPTPDEAMRELGLLVAGLSGPTMLLSDHISNYVNLTGRLPEDKPELLAEIEAAGNLSPACMSRGLRLL
jgi:radical SAM superfamily enzyme YgiQ (UPF0313 family)